jgi:hypothetical protein
MPGLMDFLQELSGVHPFIAGKLYYQLWKVNFPRPFNLAPLLALRAAYRIEMTRRDNNRKTAVLVLEMKNVMSVLTA